MKCKILHESRGRIRVKMLCGHMSLENADILQAYLEALDGTEQVKVYDRTCDAVIVYTGERAAVIKALSEFSFSSCHELADAAKTSVRRLNRDFEDKLVMTLVRRAFSKLFIPFPLRIAISVLKSSRYILKGLKALLKGKLTVEVLDAVAVSTSLIIGNFETASSIMFMLKIGEILDDWTHKKSVADLAGAMSLNVDKVWLKAEEQEVLVPISTIKAGDKIVARTGNMIPLDGKVVSGEVMVNQSSMTGESLPVRKSEGSYVYAGTVAEDGCCVIEVEKALGSGRYDRIIKMIEESEKLKSASESRASSIADRLVPFTLGGTAAVYLLTRNVTKALAVLMVDFSCALKLAIPITVISAMRECSTYGISVKGGHFLEKIANADTIVFDKTGTLTYATPKVADIITFGGNDKDEMLRLAACLEEHYPHSIANAVVKEANVRGLHHEERHTEVDYVVAHGISSTVDGESVLIGSAHFIFEDKKCIIPKDEKDKFDSLTGEYSYLYLAIAGKLSAVICISDPIKNSAKDAINELHKCGVNKIVMMTGDNKKTASKVAKAVGVDDYRAEVLPEDKAEYIRAEREKGRCVVMIGDGVNDTPALSEADVGIAVNSGAAIAREVADITISSDDLFALVTLLKTSKALMKRIKFNYRFIVSFNSLLILMGITQIIPPTVSALLHNMSTLGISLRSMKNLLKEENDK